MTVFRVCLFFWHSVLGKVLYIAVWVGQALCMLFCLLILLGSGETRDEPTDKKV